jgi:hypothetical protein
MTGKGYSLSSIFSEAVLAILAASEAKSLPLAKKSLAEAVRFRGKTPRASAR